MAERFELSVRPDEALDAFKHPFAYAACSGLRPEGGSGEHAVDQAVAELEQGIPRETASAIWYRVRSGCLELSRLAFGAGQHLEVKPEGSI